MPPDFVRFAENCFFLTFQPCLPHKGFRQPVCYVFLWRSSRGFLLGFFVGILFHCITCFLKILYKKGGHLLFQQVAASIYI